MRTLRLVSTNWKPNTDTTVPSSTRSVSSYRASLNCLPRLTKKVARLHQQNSAAAAVIERIIDDLLIK